MSNGTVCGRNYTVKQPIKPAYGRPRKMHQRYLVEGINHKHGQPIRFKSLEGAERHIRNMGWANE